MKPGIITVNYFSRVENHGRYINIYAAKHILQPFLLKNLSILYTSTFFILLAKYFKIISLLLNKCNIIRF